METSKVVNVKDKPHSYEFGKTGNRHKIYYNLVVDLVEHLEVLKKFGLLDEKGVEDGSSKIK